LVEVSGGNFAHGSPASPRPSPTPGCDAAEMSGPYMPQMVPALIQYSGDANAQVRQASVYGVGICAQWGGPLFAAHLNQALAAIQAMVRRPAPRPASSPLHTYPLSCPLLHRRSAAAGCSPPPACLPCAAACAARSRLLRGCPPLAALTRCALPSSTLHLPIPPGDHQVNAPDARDEDNGFATDNAISALGKIIVYQVRGWAGAPLFAAFLSSPLFLAATLAQSLPFSLARSLSCALARSFARALYISCLLVCVSRSRARLDSAGGAKVRGGV